MSIVHKTPINSMSLADQINDEFLTCKICFEHFKDPKCLTCLHTFCEECIEQHISSQRSYKYTDYREFSCPICRKKTVIPTGGVHKLNDNFLVSGLKDLLISMRPSKILMCDICMLANQHEREATSKCVECQKSMCQSCAITHSQMKITLNHSIYELEIEKDIKCKEHPNEQVRFYCEACEICVCIACTHTEHRDHYLVDFKEGISLHKDKIEENLINCRQKIEKLKNRLDMVSKCESLILYIQNEIHSVAIEFIKAIKEKENNLIADLDEYFGDECLAYLKTKDDMEAYLDQLKSTCNLTEMVVKGKDIEMLLLKKQLYEKFNEFKMINFDDIPKNLLKAVAFRQGFIELGKLYEPNSSNNYYLDNGKFKVNGIVTSISSTPFESNDDDYDELKEIEDNNEETRKKQIEMNTKFTQISHRDKREIMGDHIKESVVQTDIRMIHDLSGPSKFERRNTLISYDMRYDSKATQTEVPPALTSLSSSSICSSPSNRTVSHSSMQSQSSLDEDTKSNDPIDRHKLGRRVRRHVKPGCAIAVLPNSEIIIIDPESNCLSILDRRGKFRYGMSNSNKPYGENGRNLSSNAALTNPFANTPKLERGIRLLTPQGILIIKLENETTSSSSVEKKVSESSI